MKSFYLLPIIFLCCLPVSAQQAVTAKVIDSSNRKPVPFATISINRDVGVISYESGDFTLHSKNKIKKNDSLFVSCLGYREKAIRLVDFKDTLIVLDPQVIELNEVVLLNKNYTVDEIIAHVKEVSKRITTSTC